MNFTAAQALALTAAVAVTAQAPFSDLARTATRKVLDVLDPAPVAERRPYPTGSGSTSGRVRPAG